MTHSDFSIGREFIVAGKRWRCTDVGTRTIAAVCLSDHPDDESWYNGPPYAVVERVFDEYDFECCTAVDGDEEPTDGAIGDGIAADALSDTVSLRHRDGSMFLLTNARIERRGEWLLVLSELHGSQVFRQDEVTHWSSAELSSRRESTDGSTWHYQPYRTKDDVVQIYEDYFDDSGAFQGRTADPIAPMGESTEELVGDLYFMLSDAMIRPVKEIDHEDES